MCVVCDCVLCCVVVGGEMGGEGWTNGEGVEVSLSE